MRYLILYIAALLLFSGCEITFKSRAEKFKEYKAYATATACHQNEEEAKRLAIEALSKTTSIDSDSVLKKSSVGRTKEKRDFCYEAVLTNKGWGEYIYELEQEREAILSRTQKFNNTISYNDKAALVKKLLQEQKAFNAKIDRANKIAPTEIEKIDLKKSALEQSFNAIPKVKITVKGCGEGSNLQCMVTFISEVRDESEKVTYNWDFGDGENSDRRNPLHTYQTPGDYKVTLQVADENGVKSTASTQFHVAESAKAAQDMKPVALFQVKKERYKNGENINFDNRSFSKGGAVKSYAWDFGDGTVSSQRNPSHQYKNSGIYTVRLKICDSNGLCAIGSNRITITHEPAINASKGEDIHAYIAKNGQPAENLIKKKASMKGYRYGNIWLLAKRDKIECAVLVEGLSTNLLGHPKKCHWHEKYAKKYMVELK